MTSLALLAAVVLQGAEVVATVDRTRLVVGEELVVTIRARTRAAEPIYLLLPPLAGFAIVGSRDLTEVALAGTSAPLRTTVRELRLRAEQPGALLIGPVRARQGESLVATEPILVTVDTSTTGAAVALSPLARRLLDSAPAPPRAGEVALTLILPDDTVLAGQQLDLIAAAWVPRELRTRMRRLPTVTLTTPEGVWAYPPTAPAGVAASRQIDGAWVDLFIAHQVVFPLAPGRVVVQPASVDYAVPVSFSLFSREERYTLRSDSVGIVVLPLPSEGRPADDQGVVARGVTLDVRIEPAATRIGEPIEVAAAVSGVGNVSLWPAPVLRWPGGFRVYPGPTEVRLTAEGGRIAGTKTFRSLAVPDSAGRFVLPGVRYPYFDVATRRYAAAQTPPRGLAAGAGSEPRPARALPPLVPTRGEGAGLLDRAGRRVGMPGWVILSVVPPFAAWVVRRRRGRGTRGAAAGVEAGEVTRLGGLEGEFYAVLASHVPDAFARDGDGLAPALRAAGVESAVADHVRRLRDRLRAARYGPRGLRDATELAAELEQVLRVLSAEAGGGLGGTGGTVRRRPSRVLALLLVAVPAALQGQGARAEALYEAGALRAAADSFAARASSEPHDAAHWYNLGAALYRAGADGKAIAAWTFAARLAPRDPLVRRARRLLSPPDEVSRQLLSTGWATPEELGLLAAVAWVGLWAAVSTRRSRPWIPALGVLALGLGAAGAWEGSRRARPLAVVTAAAAPVRIAPYGTATVSATVPAGGAVLTGRAYGAWVAVRRPDGIRGWVLAAEVVRL